MTQAKTKPHKATKSTLDIHLFTRASVKLWKAPPFQRPLKENDKVLEIAAEVQETQIIPGVITLGKLDDDIYLIDGQHRVHAYTLSEVDEAYGDVRTLFVESMSELAEEFVRLNQHIVVFKSDDVLRGLEGSNSHLAKIRKLCPYIGYDQIQRGDRSPMISMSQALRSWFLSSPETPGSGALGSVAKLADRLNDDEVSAITSYFQTVFTAWGRDKEYGILWKNLNNTLVAWLYRRTVIGQYSTATTRILRDQFVKCCMSLTSENNYLDWLKAKVLNERNRAPAYNRIKRLFAKRIKEDIDVAPRLPTPVWSNS
jgi:hypothetical protein